MTRLNLIWAQARNGVIGNQGQLPWHLPEDLAHFKHTTLGCPVIMGRKTWDSLPQKFRPLPGRSNIVVTRQTAWQAPGAKTTHSLTQAMSLCEAAETAWVIGGAQLYTLALPHASQIVVTEVDLEPVGDAFAPPLLQGRWQVTQRRDAKSTSGMRYSIAHYNNLDVVPLPGPLA
ncbi:MAG: dihydrofolate reductase [Burkholderiales bacterium]